MPTHVVAGSVSSDGSPAGDARGDFYVRALGSGTYIVEFETAMENVPAVVVTQNYPAWNAFDYTGGDPRDNAILLAIDAKGFMVVTGDNKGSHKDRDFSFIAAARADADSIPPMVWGDINANASIRSGSGFTVTNIGDGTYLGELDPPFRTFKSLVLTQNYKDWSDFAYSNGDTRDNAVLVAVNPSQFKYITGQDTGAKSDRNCSFVAAGDRTETSARPRMVFGCVNGDLTIYEDGSRDYEVTSGATGEYTIQWITPFQTLPAVMVTVNPQSWTRFSTSSASTLNNGVLVAVDQYKAKLAIGNESGDKTNSRNFAFLVVGT